MAGREEARQLVEEISRQRCYIRQDILDRMPEADRRELQQVMLMKDRIIGSPAVTLAKNLYTSKAKFVFELLQNADNNQYTKAQALNEVPEVSFRVYLDRVVVECNEDGFTPENLSAICDFGKRSKREFQGYIGEQGIGFKSVFIVAYKAHIQSGDFSFFFQHRKGDSGMGMNTPVWTEPKDDPKDHSTTITLFLHDEGGPEELESQRQIIRRQLEEIHEAILLFTKRIQKIGIYFYDDGKDEATSTITFSIERQAKGKVAVTRSSDNAQNGKGNDDVRYYYTRNHTATGLPKDENRDYSKEEEESKSYATSEIVLAFPLSAESVPIIESQWIFPFLPISQLPFKFLIQANFITEANGKEIITTSARNQVLIKAIAQAFIDAILQLCEHDTLQYQWMRYIPRKVDFLCGIWPRLISWIEYLFGITPLLRPASGGPLQLISCMKRNSPAQLDQHGKPLLPDIKPERYLSAGYRSDDLDILASYGLSFMTYEEVLTHAEYDLASSSSKLRITEDKDWQSRVSELLIPPLFHPTDVRQRVKKLALVPLRGGGWTSISAEKVYFPQVLWAEADIPEGLGLSVVAPAAVSNVKRRRLFLYLGIESASVSFIRDQLFKKYVDGCNIDLASSISQLRFLYLTHHLSKAPYNYERLKISSMKGTFKNPSSTQFYVRCDEPYGVHNLLSKIAPGSNPGSGAPGFGCWILNKAYLENQPTKPSADRSISWVEWLDTFLKIRRYPLLIEWTGTQLSAAAKYVAQYRPEKFMGFLRTTWAPDQRFIKERDKIILELKATKVLCETDRLCHLSEAYLPTTEMKEVASRFLLDGEFFPWLKLDVPVTYDKFPKEWEPLGRAIGLGVDGPGVLFALSILTQLRQSNPTARSLSKPERVCKIYAYLQDKLSKVGMANYYQGKIQETCKSFETIFIPSRITEEPAWASADRCVWKSPPIELRSKFSLERLYTAQFQPSDSDRALLTRFFQVTLKIPDCTWRHLVDELKYLKLKGCMDADKIGKVYESLANMCPEGAELKEMKESFEDYGLIFCSTVNANHSVSWYKLSECLWSTTKIKNKVIIHRLSKGLETFFVDRLGIERLTPHMVYEKLKERHSPRLSVDEAKETILAFNSMLESEIDGEDFDPDLVQDNAIFPVKFPCGRVEVCDWRQIFFLRDRKLLADDFAKKAAFLDFSMDEIRTLYPFIRWTKMDDMYLSNNVQEISSVNPDSTEPIHLSFRDIKKKAYALLRIAVFHRGYRGQRSPRELYNLLRNAETLETDQISSKLILHLRPGQAEVVKNGAILHIEEGPTGIKIYVPKNLVQQEICFNAKLAWRLCEWMMLDPTYDEPQPVHPDALYAVQGIINASPFALSEILEEYGIGEIDISEAELKKGTSTTPVVVPKPPDASEENNGNASQPEAPDDKTTNSKDCTTKVPETPPTTKRSPFSDLFPGQVIQVRLPPTPPPSSSIQSTPIPAGPAPKELQETGKS